MQNKQKYELIKIFKEAKYEPDPDLAQHLWHNIILRDRKTARYKLWIFAFSGFASLVGLVPTFKILFADMTKSGFYEYFSLIFSDTGSILSYWKEFIFSLTESLPLMSIIFTLSLLFICFLSLRYLMKQIGKSAFTYYA